MVHVSWSNFPKCQMYDIVDDCIQYLDIFPCLIKSHGARFCYQITSFTFGLRAEVYDYPMLKQTSKLSNGSPRHRLMWSNAKKPRTAIIRTDTCDNAVDWLMPS